jgi:general secretion pathway protein K
VAPSRNASAALATVERDVSECQGTVCPVRGPAQLSKQQGVALAIVVWFIAGMSLLVAGIVSIARVDTQMAQLHVARAKAVAAGDGAIQLMLAERFIKRDLVPDGSGRPAGIYRLGDIEVLVTLTPSAGLIDLNTAPQGVLAALFVTFGKLPEGEANFLADNVVKWRGGLSNSKRQTGGTNKFGAIEDLLRVEGANRGLFDAIRDYIVAGPTGSGIIDWVAAPEALLPVLEKADSEGLEAVYKRRESRSGSYAAGEAGEGERGPGQAMSGTYRADALVSYGDKIWLRRRWALMRSSPDSTLPWRMVRTEPPRVYEGSNGVH